MFKEACITEVCIIDYHVFNACIVKNTWQVRFPYALCKPHTFSLCLEFIPKILSQHTYLAYTISPRYYAEYGFIESPCHHLHPTIGHKICNPLQQFRPVVLNPLKQASGVMECYPYCRVSFKYSNKRPIPLFIFLIKYMVKIVYRLMKMYPHSKINLFHSKIPFQIPPYPPFLKGGKGGLFSCSLHLSPYLKFLKLFLILLVINFYLINNC